MSTEVSYSDKVDYRRRAIILNTVPNYFALRSIESGTFTFTYPANVPTAIHSNISYSLDGKNWVSTNNVDSQLVTVTTPTISAGSKVYWKGTGYGNCSSRSANNYAFFTATGNFNVSGNIMSLLYGDDFGTQKTLQQNPSYTTVGTFFNLFIGSKTNLISAAKLSLPATTLIDRAYQEMFNGCSNMVEGPEVLPATTLKGYCYASMFSGCSKLETAPVLPAESLVTGCYYAMFNGCTKLNFINARFIDEQPLSVNRALTNWVNGVNGTGTFVKNTDALWTTSYGDIVPTNFTVVTK